jgi:threonine 3-dehydrogenase
LAGLGAAEGLMSVWEMSVRRQRFVPCLTPPILAARIAMLGIPPSDMSIDWTKVIFKGLHFIKELFTVVRCLKPETRWQR